MGWVLKMTFVVVSWSRSFSHHSAKPYNRLRGMHWTIRFWFHQLKPPDDMHPIEFESSYPSTKLWRIFQGVNTDTGNEVTEPGVAFPHSVCAPHLVQPAARVHRFRQWNPTVPAQQAHRMPCSCRCFSPGGLVSVEWSRCSGSKTRHARDNVALLRKLSERWIPARTSRLFDGVRRQGGNILPQFTVNVWIYKVVACTAAKNDLRS